MNVRKSHLWSGLILLIGLFFLIGCGELVTTPAVDVGPVVEIAAFKTTTAHPTCTVPPVSNPTPTAGPTVCIVGLSSEACATLQSLKQVDDYPLYTMHYYGEYGRANQADTTAAQYTTDELKSSGPAWGCSLFAAYTAGESGLFGRNFDWRYSPAVLLFTDPPGGYASVSMVDIAYLVSESDVHDLEGLPLEARLPLLEAPFWPFDGMNEHGLVVGMAAVPAGQGAPDPDKESIDSLIVMRKMLDGARDVDEALEIFSGYNVDMGEGPPLHYLIADASGRSMLLEFFEGQLVILPNDTNWQQMTNFLRASAGETAEGQCWRYDRMEEQLGEREGSLSDQEAIDLLEGVAQANTQWSIVYGMNTGEINVIMDRQYETVHTFQLGVNSAPKGRWP
jgi:hypothetical protein